ncbi:hypothetical protein [Actinoplanes sp. NPDC020271]|uniref:hypothetical protein n=1 Tax=Actinoplanes sp. NPDC020271 TaxID=3363896 RepID=UPI0037B9BF6B
MPETDSRPYGLQRPTVQDARDALHRVHGPGGPAVWAGLLTAAGIKAGDTSDSAVLHIVEAMAQLDPVSRLCAQALRIRLSSHTHLGAAHTLTRS